MGPNHYHTMTDSQLQEWHMLTTRVAKLNELLLAEQQKVARLEAVSYTAAQEKTRMEESYRADFDRLALAAQEASDAAHRDRERLKLIAQHLPTFLSDFLATYLPFEPSALTAEYRANLQAARELLLLCEPFAT